VDQPPSTSGISNRAKQTGGPFKEINTSASGVKISAHMPKTAEVMNTWPSCAQAYGTTDEEGMSVKDNPVRVMDMFATVYQGLGIDPGTQVRDAIGRPFPIAGLGGKPITALL
jgi:hypothetical protein